MVLGMVSYLSPKRLKVLDGRNILPIKIQDGGAAAILNLVIKRERPMATGKCIPSPEDRLKDRRNRFRNTEEIAILLTYT